MSFDHGHALVIGIGSYLYIPQANIPISVTDAQSVKDVLADPALCGYPAGQITFLHDDGSTRAAFLAALDQLTQSTTADDTVFLFYVGHGDYGSDGNYYLTTYDTQVSGNRVLKGTGVSEGELLARLKAIPAKRIFLAFNSCHSGEISPSLGLGEEEKTFGDMNLPAATSSALLSSGEGRIIITACRPEQKSYFGKGKLSIFSQALVDGLKGAGFVPNNQGYVGAFGLYEHLYAAVKAAAAEINKTQEPEITVLKGVGPFPVALYRGATDLGLFDDKESLPEAAAVRQVDAQLSKLYYQNIIKTVTVTASGTGAVAIGGSANGAIIQTGSQNTANQASGQNIAQAGQGGRANVNVARDIDFSVVQTWPEAAAELQKLLVELTRAIQDGILKDDAAVDAEYQMKKAIQQTQKPQPDKSSVLDHLSKAKEVVSGVAQNVTAAVGLATAVNQAIQMVQRLV